MGTANLEATDVVRLLLISLICLLAGLVGFGLWQAWRDRREPVQRKVPTKAVYAFGVGYLSMLAAVAIERFDNLGDGLTFEFVVGAGTMLINIAAVCVILYYRRDEDTLSLFQYAHRPGILPGLLRFVIFRQAIDDERWERATGESVHPARRRDDARNVMEMAEEVRRVVGDENKGEQL
jgi:hypothetical protein